MARLPGSSETIMKQAKAFFNISLAALTTLFVCAFPANSQSTPGEHHIKAAMIYNMAKFTDWPTDALPAGPGQFNICVLGKGRMGVALESLQGKQIRGRSITVRQINQPADGAHCQILVVTDAERRQAVGIIEKTRQHALLTISDTDGFARAGGVVGFVIEEGKVRFEINPTAAQRHRLRISAQVLKLSRIVQDEP